VDSTMMMLSSWLSLSSALLLLLPVTEAGNGKSSQFNPVGSMFNGFVPPSRKNGGSNTTLKDLKAPTPKEREEERQARRERHLARNARVKETMKYMRPDTAQKVSKEELEELSEDHPALRKLWGNGQDNTAQYADPGDDYDMWQQAYRMLGVFIDCDHAQDGDGDSHDDNGEGGGACSRWMMWASYVDPNYQGNGYDEYFGDEPTGVMDCHNPNTEWVLLGVYRQEFYQFIEQISKHLWAIDDYEYVVALAGLAYFTDDECFYVGATSDDDATGVSIYAGIAPQKYGKFVMALYTDQYCLYPNEDLGMTFDDYGLTSDVSLGSGDGDGGDDDGGSSYTNEWWEASQEYTFTQLNDVYDEFKYCTSCIDYPTYQDGYFIGDDGTDEDDLINQCWKFYSHDSYPCEADCIAMGHSQGTILSVVIGDKIYGQTISEFYSEEALEASAAKKTAQEESKVSRLLANTFVTFAFIVFVATFLAFAVARRSRYRESRSSKSRRLLDEDDRSPRSKRSSRSKSKKRDDAEEGDGLFRTSSRKSRSKSGSKRNKSSRSRSKGRSDKESKRSDAEPDYEPPRRSRSTKRSSSRGRSDDF
jgi:hypothetical protein